MLMMTNGYSRLVSVFDQVLEGLAWDDRGYEVQEVRSLEMLSSDGNKLGVRHIGKNEQNLYSYRSPAVPWIDTRY